LGEHQLDKLGVTGSSPVPPISRCHRDDMLDSPKIREDLLFGEGHSGPR